MDEMEAGGQGGRDGDRGEFFHDAQAFWERFPLDLKHTRESAVIYCPFVARRRIDALRRPLEAAANRGVKLYVITKPLGEHARRYQPAVLEQLERLRAMDARLRACPLLHEKAILLDGRILWFGSLNLLSQGRSRECMCRFENPEVIRAYVRFERLHERLMEADYLPAREEAPRCPLCGAPMEQRVNGGTGKVFYGCSRYPACRGNRSL